MTTNIIGFFFGKLAHFFTKLWAKICSLFSRNKQSTQLIANFKFIEKPSAIFGTIYQPLVNVRVWSAWLKRWLTIPMIVDTGADYTILPRFLAVQLGIDLAKDCKKMTTVGVGGNAEVYFYPNLEVKLGKTKRQIPVGFASSSKIPALMGRQAFFETFVSKFNKTKEIEFYEHKAF